MTVGCKQWQHWQPLLQLELLDAVALQEPPPEDAPVAMPYRLLPSPMAGSPAGSSLSPLSVAEG